MNKSLTQFEEYAVIDLGSNSFHMAIARYINGAIQVFYKQKQHVQLAIGLNEKNELSHEVMKRGIECLALFAERLKGFPAENVKIIATHTLRVAINRYEFLAEAMKVLPYPIEVISGPEEARLIYVGMKSTEPTNNIDVKVVIDIGGGSTEIALGKSFTPILTVSRPMGSVTYATQFFPQQKIDKVTFFQAQLSAKQQIKNIIEQIKNYNISMAFGASGTIKSIYNILLDIGVTDGIITPKRLNDLISYVLKFEHFQDIDYPSLSEERKQVFVSGLAIFSAIFEAFQLKELHYGQSALREGVLYELTGGDNYRNVRKKTAESLSKQYNIDNSHADQVTRTAKYLLTQWSKQTSITIDPSLTSLVYWAAQLHEIGLSINFSSIHKHSSYILQHSNLPGFNEEQQLLLSTLVRYHRKSIDSNHFPYFSIFENKHIFPLLQILRLAILLNNQRTTEIDTSVFNLKTISNNNNAMLLEIEQPFAEKNQLILLDLEQEQKYWKTMRNWQLSVAIIGV